MKYPWCRRWLLQGTSISHDSFGFATSNTYSYRNGYRPGGFLLPDLNEIKCAVLLGEPGLGKSTEIKKECKESSNTLIRKELIHLNSRSSEGGLVQLLKEKLTDWKSTGGEVFLYLDGLDEGLLQIRNVFQLIIEWIEQNREVFNLKNGTEEEATREVSLSLYLRISCRSAIWSEDYKKELERIFGSKSCMVCELAPLEQEEVRVAARENNFDPDVFVESVREAGLASFAMDPVSLNFLILAYRKGSLGQSHHNKAKIYYDGLIELCKENNQTYQFQKQLSAIDRYLLISRIAVYSIFSKLPLILKPRANYPSSNEPVLLPDHISMDFFKISGESERKFSFEHIEEVLNTGVFTLGPTDWSLVWKHRTFGEFLAAWHLNQINIPLEHILQLFSSTIETNKVPPQYYEVVLWLATFKKDLFDKLVKHEPLLLLRIHREISFEERKDIVHNILQLSISNNLSFDHWSDTRNFGRLSHSDLANQIKPFLDNSSTNDLAKHMLLYLAAACNLVELKNELVTIVSDKSISTYLKRIAIEILGTIDDPDIKRLLAPYALKQMPDDYDDELKGQAILSLYPWSLSTDALFRSLTKPKMQNVLGTYRAAISSIGDKIPEEDLEVAIDSIYDNSIFFEDYGHNELEDVLKSSLNRAWRSPKLHSYKQKLANLIIKLKENYVDFEVIDDDEKRRDVLFYVIEFLSRREENGSWLLHSVSQRLLQNKDWQWLTSIVKNVSFDENLKIAAGELLVSFVHIDDNKIQQDLINLANEVDWFGKKYRHELLACDIDSTKSEKDKSIFQRQKRNEQRQSENNPIKKIKYDPVEKSLQELILFEGGDVDAWRRLIGYMRIDAIEESHAFEFEMDIREFPVWKKLTLADQERVIQAAHDYLIKFKLTNEFQYNTYSGLAAYRALFLLSTLTDNESIEGNIKKWLPVIIYYNLLGYGQKTDISSSIVKKAYEIAPNEFIEQLKEQIRDSSGNYQLDRIEDVFEQGISEYFLEWVEEGLFDEKQRPVILNTLTKYNPEILIQKFKEEYNSYLSNNLNLPKLIDLSVEALKINPVETWNMIKSIILSDSTLGKDFLVNFMQNPFAKTSSFNELTPDLKGEILIWLYENYPPESDSKHDGTHFFQPVDYVVMLRSQLLTDLINQGTAESLQALQLFCGQLSASQKPNTYIWLMNAKKIAIEKLFESVEPRNLRRILHDGQQRLVRTSEELLQVILESLHRFQAMLKGKNPISYFLWDKVNDGSEKTYTHKDENSFSDFVKMHLEYDLRGTGIIIDREVEIKRAVGRGTGERTDILVQAFNPENPSLRSTVVIEAKGCWHNELKIAMKSQLIDRYLSEWKADCGIYLVGWFHDENLSNVKCPHKDFNKLNELKSFLIQQAEIYSTPRNTIKAKVLDCSL